MQISLVGAGYWGVKLRKELESIPNVDSVEIIDIKDGKTLIDMGYSNVINIGSFNDWKAAGGETE